MSLNLPALLKAMTDKGASDLHITVGSPPRLRIDGDKMRDGPRYSKLSIVRAPIGALRRKKGAFHDDPSWRPAACRDLERIH